MEERDNRFNHWVGMDNYGLLTIEEGIIDESGIVDNLKILFDKNWTWQLKKSDEFKYIVRFPPDRKVENIVIGRASVFDMNKEGVVASLSVWNGEIEPVGSLTELWVQIQGIPPKWVDWKSVGEVASGLGRMVDIDWQLLFNSFFSSVRAKIQCKDPSKILRERLFVFKGNVHLIVFTPEGIDIGDNSEEESDEGDDEEEKPEDKQPEEGDVSESKKGEEEGDKNNRKEPGHD